MTSITTEINELAVALAKAQSEITNPKNTANNPFFKSKYAPLSEVINVTKPILAKYGLSFLQSTTTVDGMVGVSTLLLHTSGQYIETEPLFVKPVKDDPQGMGSAVTYARRYSLSALLGIIGDSEDDDGNAASKVSQEAQRKADQFNYPGDRPLTDDDIKPILCEICGNAITGYTQKNGNVISPQEVANRSEKKYGKCICVACARSLSKKDEGNAEVQG